MRAERMAMSAGKKNGNGRGGGAPKKGSNGREPTVKEQVTKILVRLESMGSDISNLKKGVSHLRRRVGDVERSLGDRIDGIERSLGERIKRLELRVGRLEAPPVAPNETSG